MASKKSQFVILLVLALVITCLAADKTHQRNHNRHNTKNVKKRPQADAPLPGKPKRM